MKIRMEHVRAASLCSKGARYWFAQRGWNWQEFLEHGIDEETLVATGDPYARRVVEIAHNE